MASRCCHRCRPRRRSRRGHGAVRRERRRQVHLDEDPLRRSTRRTPGRWCSTGRPYNGVPHPCTMQGLGVSMIHQELNLLERALRRPEHLPVPRATRRRSGLIDFKKMNDDAARPVQKLGRRSILAGRCGSSRSRRSGSSRSRRRPRFDVEAPGHGRADLGAHRKGDPHPRSRREPERAGDRGRFTCPIG